MPSDVDFINHVIKKINFGTVMYKEMFGQYCICVTDKPVLFIWDNIVHVKKTDTIKRFFIGKEATVDLPIGECYSINDIDNYKNFIELIKIIEETTEHPLDLFDNLPVLSQVWRICRKMAASSAVFILKPFPKLWGF
jgi:hypothetical protein